MNKFFVESLADYFNPAELVEFLDGEVTIYDVISAFEDQIAEKQEELEEYIKYGR